MLCVTIMAATCKQDRISSYTMMGNKCWAEEKKWSVHLKYVR